MSYFQWVSVVDSLGPSVFLDLPGGRTASVALRNKSIEWSGAAVNAADKFRKARRPGTRRLGN